MALHLDVVGELLLQLRLGSGGIHASDVDAEHLRAAGNRARRERYAYPVEHEEKPAEHTQHEGEGA
jgi:hypothetical protein